MGYKKPLILDIKGNSLDDGPGIRTVIFFKGCPLSCVWCHNPEAKYAEFELAWDSKECIGCNSCVNVCELGAISRETPSFVDRKKCNLCFKCVEVCPAVAMAKVGRAMEIDEIVEVIKKDIPFFDNSGGGVTLSGGEPTLFIEFASDLLRKLRALGIHSIIETCGQFNYGPFMELMYPYLDAIFYDIKLFDPREHGKYCGVDNSRILSNFEKLYRLYHEGGIEVLPRIALIPDITDTQKNLKDIALFLKKSGVTRVALLQYNPLWVEKAKKLGVANSYAEVEKMTQWMARSYVKECFAIFDDFEVNTLNTGVLAFRGANRLVSRC
jgi:pyruvate formate lyase activating enzyme